MFPQLDASAGQGKLAENVMHFARLLRAAGLRIGPDRVIDCVRALEIAGAERREDWYWTMSAVLLSREEQRPVFDQAFRIFWRDPKLIEKMMQMLLPQVRGRAPKPEDEQSQRLTDALFGQKETQPREQPEDRTELDARLTFSSSEVLQRCTRSRSLSSSVERPFFRSFSMRSSRRSATPRSARMSSSSMACASRAGSTEPDGCATVWSRKARTTCTSASAFL